MLTRLTLALLLLLPASASAQELDKAVSALVRISGMRGGTPVRGSGFVVGLDRDKATIVTASRVIEGVQQLEITFAADRTESFSARLVLGTEAGNQRGLAALQVLGALPAGVIALSFETEDRLQQGEDLFLLGFPEASTTPLALWRRHAGPNGNFLQLDGSVEEAFSGAPVFLKDKVVGVVTVTDEDLQRVFAVKATVARKAVVGWGARLGGHSSIQSRCEPGEEYTRENIVFVLICPATFTMGAPDNDSKADDNERPAHQVTLSEFWISKTEMTNAQYRRFRRGHKGPINRPVTAISWEEAKAACEHFGGRLPTEAEWEYAARAGSQTVWSFGEDERKLGTYAWFIDNSGNKLPLAGSKAPNSWGLYDMHGSVWEWVADWYAPYPGAAQTDPSGPTTGEYHILRGGSYLSAPGDLRSGVRSRYDPKIIRSADYGFRCAYTSSEQP